MSRPKGAVTRMPLTKDERVSLAQDATLEKHYLHFVRGCSEEYGPKAAEELARIIRLARQEYGLTFGGLVSRLLQAEAQANHW